MRLWDCIYKDGIIEVYKFKDNYYNKDQYKVIRHCDPIKDYETGELLWPLDVKVYEEIPMSIIRDMKLSSLLD